MGWSHTHTWQVKSRREISRMKGRSTTPGPPAQGSSASKINLHNSGCKKPAGTEAVEDRKCCSLRQFLLKGPCRDLLGLTPSELQHQGSRLKGITDIGGGTELSSINVKKLGSSFLTDKSAEEATVPFLSPAPTKPAGGCLIRVSTNLAHTVRPTLVIP